ncbi:YtxH domain-containing protein [Pedobacter sp.]|uniref:YtxH domain-containing protein n=1 Tax=Pedobacter sp. TaxID=1411316 RepID=UPI003D7F4F8C
MKLNKLLSKCTRQHTDSSMPIVALLAGLAVGAVVGVLFAPEKGADVRGKISDKAGDLASSVKDKIQSVKEKLTAESEKAVEVKDQVVDDVRKKTKATADHLSGETDATAGKNEPIQNS